MVSIVPGGDSNLQQRSFKFLMTPVWLRCYKNRSSAGSHSILITHGHVIENDTVHTAPNCCNWCQFDSLSGSWPRNNGCRSFLFLYGHSMHSIGSVCTLCSLHVESACSVEFECFACSFVGALPCSHIGHTKSRNRSKNLGITCILLSFFQSQCMVYVKMPFHPPNLKRRWYSQSVHVYVGSTAISAAKREFNRFAKLKQVQHSAVHVELSIRYCSSRTDFDS